MQGNRLHKTKMTLFIFLALALSALSFHGALDDFAHESVVKTTNESIALFAISRGINAAVSFFQEAKIPFLEVPVGQLLDPLNDAIERLSSVLVWAIGSLFLQRVALEVASSFVSKWSFLAIALVSVTTILLGTWQRFRHLFQGWERFRDLSVRFFIYLVVFRFIVPVFAIIGFLVSYLLFDAEINKNKEELSLFSEEISVNGSAPALGTQEAEDEQALKASELDELRKRMAHYLQEAEALKTQIQELRSGVGLRRYLPESLGGVPAGEQRALTPSGLPELDELVQSHSVLTREAEALEIRIQELRGGDLRRYFTESLGSLAVDAQSDLTPSGLPELDELVQSHSVLTREAEALEIRIQELRAGSGLRRYLPESLGGVPADEQRAHTPSGLPELNELVQSHSVLMREAEALDGRIQELRDEAGLRHYLPESLGGVPPGEQLASAEARREKIRSEMEIVEDRIHTIERQLLVSAEKRQEQIRLELESINSQVRAIEREQLASAEARLDDIHLEMETVEARIRVVETEQLTSAEARLEEIRRETETADSEIRAVEEELECIEKRRAGEDCVSLLGKLSSMGAEGYTRVRELIGKAGEVVTTIVKLTIVVVVKNVLLPMAFLMIAVKYALPLARYWARLTSDFRRDVRELGDTLSPETGRPRLKESSEDT